MKHEKGHEPGHAGHEHTEVAGIRFEETDINYRPITIAALFMTVSVFVFTGLAWVTFQYLRSREATLSAPANPMAAQHARKQPPEPRLQADPRGDLLALRAAEEAVLGKLAWVNRRNGVVQVPIERAMQIVVSKGLPVRPNLAAGPSPALPLPGAPAAGPTPALPDASAPGAAGPAPSLPLQPDAPSIGGTSAPRPADAAEQVSPEDDGH